MMSLLSYLSGLKLWRICFAATLVSFGSICLSLAQKNQITLTVLGTMQDGGLPHIGCMKNCCKDTGEKYKVVSLGLADYSNGKSWLIEATPDLPEQLKALKEDIKSSHPAGTDGIFLSHAHIGHYSGLMYLGKEALGASGVTVYAMPRMTAFLNQNGPWSQLVTQKNISISPMSAEVPVVLSENLKVTPVQVPHRDEFSETVGFVIEGPAKKVLFIPDIDKWEKWDKDILAMIRTADVVLIDGTFFSNEEIGYRDIKSIPHPLVSESMEKFKALPETEKKKIYFIHLNHTNPLLKPESRESEELRKSGFKVAFTGLKFQL